MKELEATCVQEDVKRRARILNEGRVERLAKRKQWILFNLIQLIYYGKKGHRKTYPIVFAIHLISLPNQGSSQT